MSEFPAGVPILSPGRHLSPEHGGCFMEIASLLAGEQWSDRPHCTHPLLAAIARSVNDRTSDQRRPALVPLIPSVIGTYTEDPRVAPLLVARCARSALAFGIRPRRHLTRALQRAEGMLADGRVRSAREQRRYLRSATYAVHLAIVGLAARPDGDKALRALLAGAISDVRDLVSGALPAGTGGRVVDATPA